MISAEQHTRASALAKLASTREELRVLFEPAVESTAGPGAPGKHAVPGFPRSRTMQMLLSGKGIGTVGALVGGVIAARPALALRLLRLVPVTAVGKLLLGKGIGLMRDRYIRRR